MLPSGIATNEKLPKFTFFISTIFFVSVGIFTYGLEVGHYKVWPFLLIKDMKKAVASFYVTGRVTPEYYYNEAPTYASRQRISIRYPESMIDGYRAIMGIDNDTGSYVTWLIDETGETHHSWPINYTTIDPEGSRWAHPHGLGILRDGSVLVNFNTGRMMARLDACGSPMWIKKGHFHHSFDRAEDGSYWTWEGKDYGDGHYQFLVNFDPETGHTIRSLSLVDDFIKPSTEHALLFSIPPRFKFGSYTDNPKHWKDIFHPNDIEVLTSEMAVHFPQFSPGDLLISLRTLNLVAVLDPENKIVKWTARGPWRQQHDPDFYPDGTIGVYDNNRGFQRSSIISIDPSTGKAKTKFANGDLQFFAGSMGKHQRLPHGGELIVISEEGRIVEVDSAGNIVFEFNNVISEKFNVHVENAMWLPPDFFSTKPACN